MSTSKLFSEYRPTLPNVSAALVTRQNVHAVARIIGGEVIEEAKASDPTDVAVTLLVPSLRKPIMVNVATPQYIVRSLKDNKLTVDYASNFEAQYDQIVSNPRG